VANCERKGSCWFQGKFSYSFIVTLTHNKKTCNFLILQLLRTVEVHNLNNKLVVQRLEDMAFEVSHKEILASFQEFRNYFTEESAR